MLDCILSKYCCPLFVIPILLSSCSDWSVNFNQIKYPLLDIDFKKKIAENRNMNDTNICSFMENKHKTNQKKTSKLI